VSDNPNHECRRGRRCKSRVKTAAGTFHGALIDRPDALCRLCEDSAFEAIRELGEDYAGLCCYRFEDRSQSQGPKVGGTNPNPSIPVALGVDALMARIDDETLRWALRITRGDPVPDHHVLRVRACVATLGANLGTLVDLPKRRLPTLLPHPDGGDFLGLEEMDGVDAVLRLASFHHRAQTLMGEVETITWQRDPCPHCGRKALAASKDQEYVSCKGCGITWDSAHFAQLYNILDFERKVARA
jgi:hypothetical protein